MSTGKAAVLDKPMGTFRVEEFAVPEPAPGTVLLRQELAGCCATDAHAYLGQWRSEFPVIFGHENVGIVEAIGAGGALDLLGRELRVGDRVVARTGSCGACYECRIARLPRRCRNLTVRYGFTSPERAPFARRLRRVPLPRLAPDDVHAEGRRARVHRRAPRAPRRRRPRGAAGHAPARQHGRGAGERGDRPAHARPGSAGGGDARHRRGRPEGAPRPGPGVRRRRDGGHRRAAHAGGADPRGRPRDAGQAGRRRGLRVRGQGRRVEPRGSATCATARGASSRWDWPATTGPSRSTRPPSSWPRTRRSSARWARSRRTR